MNYLLDTHALIWSVFDPLQLSDKARHAIENPVNNVSVSAVNFWEISLKFSIGKLELDGVMPHEFPELAIKTGFELIPLTSNETSSYHLLKENTHRDPFDRMLIWQAIRNEMVLITKDESIKDYQKQGLKILW